MYLMKFIACPSCFDTQEATIGQDMPACSQCSSKVRKMKYIPMNIHDTIFLNILRTLRNVKK